MVARRSPSQDAGKRPARFRRAYEITLVIDDQIRKAAVDLEYRRIVTLNGAKAVRRTRKAADVTRRSNWAKGEYLKQRLGADAAFAHSVPAESRQSPMRVPSLCHLALEN